MRLVQPTTGSSAAMKQKNGTTQHNTHSVSHIHPHIPSHGTPGRPLFTRKQLACATAKRRRCSSVAALQPACNSVSCHIRPAPGHIRQTAVTSSSHVTSHRPASHQTPCHIDPSPVTFTLPPHHNHEQPPSSLTHSILCCTLAQSVFSSLATSAAPSRYACSKYGSRANPSPINTTPTTTTHQHTSRSMAVSGIAPHWGAAWKLGSCWRRSEHSGAGAEQSQRLLLLGVQGRSQGRSGQPPDKRGFIKTYQR
jgi:hypothetical protein